MALVTPQSNRVDTFAALHGITESQVVAYNLDHGSRPARNQPL